MDLPQYLHHHPRYAPSHPPSSDPNFPTYPHRNHHNNYHHHHTPPPPSPQPPQLRPPPPPPQSPSSYKALPPSPLPPHPQRTFSPHPIDSDHSRTFSPRANHRAALDTAERPRHRLSQFVDHHYRESGPDSWDRPRNYSPRDYDRELLKPQYRRDSQSDGGSARFRSEYERDRRAEDNFRHRSNNHDTSYREMEFQNSNSSSGCYDESAYEELLKSGRRYEAYEIQRWGLERPQAEEDLYDPFELDERDEDEDEDRIVSDKRDYYGSESARISSSRWKQIQKKSALLRLQTPKPRDRNYSAYFDNSGSGGSFRGKEQYEYSGHGRDEEEGEERRGGEERGQEQRGGSPLDLDVSFKSNSLVAKTVRNRDERRGSVSDRDCSDSPPTKLTEDVVNLDTAALVSNKTSSPDKDALKLKGENTTSGMNSQPCSVVTDDAFVKSEVERESKGKSLHKDGKNLRSRQMSSLKVSKKTKVVKKTVAKKTVKKVTNPTSQPKSKIDEPGTSFVYSPFAGTGKGEASSISDPCPNDLCVLPVNTKVDVSDEYGSVLNSCSKNIGNNSTANLGSSSAEEINADQRRHLNVDTPVKGLLSVSNFNSNVTDSIRVAACPEICGVVDVSKPICQSGDILSPDKVLRKESSQSMLAVEGNLSSGFLNSDKMHESMNLMGSEHGAETTLDLDSGIKMSHQEIMVLDVGTVDAISEQPCRYQLPTSLQNGGFVEELPKAISSAESNMAVGLSSSGETKAVRSKIGRRTRWDSDEVYVRKDKNITVSNGGNTNSFGKQRSPDCAARSFDICATERSPNIPESVGDTKSATPMVQKKRKVKTQLDFSRMSDTCVEPINVSVRKNALDTTVSSFLKDPSHAEVSVHGVQKLDIRSQPGNDGVSVLNGKISVNGFCEAKPSARIDVNYDTNETSPKRRKVSGSHLVLTTAQTNRGPADKSTSYTHESLTCNDPTDQADKGTSSSIGSQCATSNLIPSHEEINVYLEEIMAGVSSDTVGAARDAFTNDDMKFEHQVVDSSSVSEGSGTPQIQFLCPSESRNEENEDSTEVMVVNNNHHDIMDIDGSHEKDFDVCATNEQVMIHGETAPCTIHSELPADLGDNSFCTNMESDYLYVKPFVSNCLLSFANGSEVTTTNSNDEGMKSVPDKLSDTGTPETSTIITDMHILTCNPSVIKSFDEKVCGDDQKFDVKSVVASAGDLISETKTNLTLDHVTEGDQSVTGKTVPLKLQNSKKTSDGLHLISAESALKSQLGQATRRIVPGRPYSSFTTSQKTTSSTHISKPRTWHRNANSSASPLPASMPFSSTLPPQRQLPQRNGKIESNSYVRKGNCLVRRRAPVAAVPQSSQGLSSSVYQTNFSGIDGLKKNAGSDCRVDFKNPLNLMRTGGMNAPSDRPTAPLPNGAKISTAAAISSGIPTLSPLAEPLLSGFLETSSDPMNSSETKDAEGSVKDLLATSVTRENNCGPVNNLHDGNLASSHAKKIIYVKRNLNQLVASSNPSDLSDHNADKNQPSDGYYKRRKHQLIRSSLESNGKQTVLLPTDNLNSGMQRARKVIPSRMFNKKRSLKAVARTSKKNSLVWTPSGTQPSNNNGSSFDHQKVLPHLFPWKRARYWRTVMQSQASNFNYSSSSTISKKLLLSRMRDTVYTRSTHGFSLRKYKVLSVGGSSLKWSKSIESRSKKVNEEATRAVAEVEKKKREHNGAACTSSGSKIRNNSPGKRIFRIGSVRYKMDPSRRTLKRISDDESSSSAVRNPEKDAKRSYVPRRLVIGNDEYVRIGNGNQLIRDPKKRTRILASERVRWSLHTARQRLAKKRKYCQFFTRFGKCNKDDGKCTYIHDPSKIAVCTKFLNGLCSNPNCKLTHKVIPERMPDCSFFLQGLCTNKNCSYRHVNVNPKASTCEGFLKGYCADGNECRKKHSYVCPTFEETGTCPQGLKCKLHHPRKRTKGKIKKRSREHKNGWGRYFVSKDVSVSEPITASGKHCAQNGDDIFGNDFISIDVSDEEAGESNNPPEQTTFYDSDPSELDLDDLDELIKPVRLLDKMKTNTF